MPGQISMVSFTVLVVDDDVTCLSIVSSMLRKWKYQVIAVNSPDHALATVQIQKVDVVVSELHMPKMNGFELQKRINKQYKLPVVIMSSDDKETIIIKALNNGAAFFIAKPVNLEDLKNIWQYAIASRNAKSTRNIERIGCRGGGGSLVIGRKTSRSEENKSTSSVNEGKNDGNKKDGRRRPPGKNKENEDQEENSVPPKKPKVVWTNSLHSLFLEAIRHITLEKAVPKKIFEYMNVPGLTRENIASHLQKYRIFLKRVAEKGILAALMDSMTIDSTFLSTIAAGHASLLYKSSQEPYSQFNRLDKQAIANSALFQSLQSSFLNSMGGLSGSNSMPSSLLSSSRFGYGHSRLLSGDTRDILHNQICGSTNPLYQPNRAGFGLGSNDAAGTNMLSRAATSDTNSMLINDSGTFGVWNPSGHGTPSNSNESTRTGNVSLPDANSILNNFDNINHDENQISNDSEVLLPMSGQKRVNIDDLDGAGFGLINGADLTQSGDSTFGNFLAPGESSSSGSTNVNYQVPITFSGVNEQGGSSALSSMAQQLFGLNNNEKNDFMIDSIMNHNNNASAFDNLADPQQFGGIADMLPPNYKFPCPQLSGGEDVQNSNFTSNSSFNEANTFADIVIESINYSTYLEPGGECVQNPNFGSNLSLNEEGKDVENPDFASNSSLNEATNPPTFQPPNILDFPTPILNAEDNRPASNSGEMSPPTSQPMNGFDLPSPMFNVGESRRWREPTLEQLEEIAEFMEADFNDNIKYFTDGYFGWDEEFIKSLFKD